MQDPKLFEVDIKFTGYFWLEPTSSDITSIENQLRKEIYDKITGGLLHQLAYKNLDIGYSTEIENPSELA
jgi:hypothetical protein